MKKSLTNQRERDEKYGNLSCQILSPGIMLTPSVVNKINVMLHSASAACSQMAPVQVHSIFLHPVYVDNITEIGLEVGSLTRHTSTIADNKKRP